MSTPSPERIKAFLDDMALLCLKHGIGLVEKSCGQEYWFEVADLNGSFGGFQVRYGALDIFEAGKPSNEWVKARSIDVSTITAHQRIALTRSLGMVGGFASGPEPDRLPLVGEAVNHDFGWWS